MSEMTYTREDMKAAYLEGVELALENPEALPFPDFMLKNYPADATDIYTVHWGEVDDDTAYYQDFPADNMQDAAHKAFRLLSDKKLNIFTYHVEKKA